MRGFIILIFIAIFCGQRANALPDTVYFNNDWNVASVGDYTYFRILKIEDNILTVKDYYSSGMIRMVGTITYGGESLEQAKTIQNLEGYELNEFKWYTKNGAIYHSINYTPSLDGLDSLLSLSVDTNSLKHEKKYFMNGNIKEEGLTTANGDQHGKWFRYHKRGHKSKETEYDNGVIIRTQYSYADDGTIISSTEYENGERHGTQKLFDDQGRLKVTRIYDHGTITKERKRYLSITRAG
jgi:antitoxin component YwqK of YwqJK toxin-antitoxin module